MTQHLDDFDTMSYAELSAFWYSTDLATTQLTEYAIARMQVLAAQVRGERQNIGMYQRIMRDIREELA